MPYCHTSAPVAGSIATMRSLKSSLAMNTPLGSSSASEGWLSIPGPDAAR
jgi:hypothetical protein